MKYKIYRLRFTSAVHFGGGRLAGTDSTFHADRLFSAMCIEAKKLYGTDCIEKLVSIMRKKRLCISDGFPFIDDTYYLPKPMVRIEAESDSSVKKAFKKLPFIPSDKLDVFLTGGLDAETEAEKFSRCFGRRTVKSAAAIYENDDAEPYRVGAFEFEKNSGLYFIFGYEDEDAFDLADNIVYSLGFSGIGGKISSGLGKFEARLDDVPDNIKKRLTGDFGRYMSLSVCMAKENELESAVGGASYGMIKRSGFIGSPDYSDTQLKRKELYFFTAGSCFDCRFEGDVFNCGGKGAHPVYRYGIPMLLGVK